MYTCHGDIDPPIVSRDMKGMIPGKCFDSVCTNGCIQFSNEVGWGLCHRCGGVPNGTCRIARRMAAAATAECPSDVRRGWADRMATIAAALPFLSVTLR
jgi:hypothetical protein